MLSKRDLEILQHKNEGATNEEIGTALHLSLQTVKDLSSAIYRKLGVHNGKEAVAKARQMGVIHGGEGGNPDEAIVLLARETKVAQLLAQGKSNEAIAHELGLKPSTVRGYVSDMLTRFQCRNRIELASVLVERGIIQQQ